MEGAAQVLARQTAPIRHDLHGQQPTEDGKENNGKYFNRYHSDVITIVQKLKILFNFVRLKLTSCWTC